MITHMIQRDDAVVIGHDHLRRFYVPTTWETVFVSNWEQFKSVGGRMLFNEDYTEITLSLPPGHKFSCQFNREG